MTSLVLIRRLFVATAVIAAFAISPTSLAAQQNAPNTTGLPMYPKLNTGSEYPSVKTKTGRYKTYTAQSPDAVAVVEAWYRKALPHAVETRDDNSFTHGIILTVGKDKVLVYSIGKSTFGLVELQKYLGS
ncbi:MAG: hypothetical protein H0U66_10065 [Gemmatimonadaceae bacterium]|nr:hypothetical protein [Gemmatimonadaceae bacterium]